MTDGLWSRPSFYAPLWVASVVAAVSVAGAIMYRRVGAAPVLEACADSVVVMQGQDDRITAACAAGAHATWTRRGTDPVVVVTCNCVGPVETVCSAGDGGAAQQPDASQ